jgi:hypothetical protein
MNSHSVFWAGFMSFFIVNFIENLIYYSLGRSHKLERTRIFLPNGRELFTIIVIMTIFALLQAIFTNIIDVNVLDNHTNNTINTSNVPTGFIG